MAKPEKIPVSSPRSEDAPKKVVKELSELPTAQEQIDAKKREFHTINLLDKSTVEMPLFLTLDDLLKKRIDAKISALYEIIKTEVSQFVGMAEEQKLGVVLSSSESVFNVGINILASLCGVVASRFTDNISSEEFISAILRMLKLIADVMGKKP